MSSRVTLKNNHKNLNPRKSRYAKKSRKHRDNFEQIHNWSKLMKEAPTLFKGKDIVVIVDNKCGNIYVDFTKVSAHLSLHYLHNNLKKEECEYWTKSKKNKQYSNIHYKIDYEDSSIYIPIYLNSTKKFTYNSNKIIEPKHRKLIEWSINKLNTYTAAA